MRILIAGNAYHPALNGQAIFTQNLAEGLARRGHQVLIIYASEKGHPYRRNLNQVQVEAVRAINLNKIHTGTAFCLFPGKSVRELVRGFQPEIVHIQDHYPLCRFIVRIAQKQGIRIIGSNHFMPENLAPYLPGFSKLKPVFNRVLWLWMLEVYQRVDVVIAQSEAAAAMLRAQGLRVPIFPVSCGIDLTRFRLLPEIDRAHYRARYGIDQNRTVFLYVGRVDKEKRLDVLLHALQRLDRADLQLVIAGNGREVEKLKSLAELLTLGTRVCFTGFIPGEDLPALLNSVDIFVMPSDAELLSIATLEAMACGRPVLLANAAALPELATNQVNGLLFTPGDVTDAARCMEHLADSSGRWPEMGRASLERAKLHSLEITLSRYESLYEKLAAGVTLDQAPDQVQEGDRVNQDLI